VLGLEKIKKSALKTLPNCSYF